ncbi:helix-turn-helix transcriptional regulator [Streptomyces sp. NP160]|uniref:helix-turn-helix domain-containing protein n=1 Tax=Streptomyces sp. NP160 TaxID=2586637 RepID=UPI0015D62356|nr:helix-turn-helix transcriptional regulator [Streptomyces sp. NP160]
MATTGRHLRGEPAHDGQRAPDAPWAQRVARSLAAMGMRREDLARALTDPDDPSRHVGVSTLRTWMKGTTEPPRERVSQIARLLEIDEALLYGDLGWLDVHQLTTARDGIGSAVRALELLHSPAGDLQSGAHQLVSRALELGHDVFCWTRTWTPAAPADGDPQPAPVPLRHYVGVTADRAAQRTGWMRPTRPADGERRDRFECQQDLTEAYDTAMRLAPALVEDRPLELALCQERHPAQLWLWVPLLLAGHPPRWPADARLEHLRRRHDVVVVVGPRGSGPDAVGAWLARDAGFGFLSTAMEAQRVYGRSFPPTERQRFLHARQALWVGTAALRPDRWHGHVVAHSPAQSAHDLVHDVHVKSPGSRVLVVHLRADGELGEFLADHFPHDADSQVEHPGERTRPKWALNRDSVDEAVAEVRRATAGGTRRPAGAASVEVVEVRLDLSVLTELARTRAARRATPSDDLLDLHHRTYLRLHEELVARVTP